MSCCRLHLGCQYVSADHNMMPDFPGNEATDLSPAYSEMSLALGNFQVPGLAFYSPVQYRPYMLRLLQFCK